VITGIGEVTLDVLVNTGDDERLRIEGLRCGGTVANVLANAAASGAKACAVTVHGDDWRGEYAVADAHAAGVQVHAIAMPERLSQMIFQLPSAKTSLLYGEPWRTSNKCPVCDSSVRQSRLASLSRLRRHPIEFDCSAVVCLDRLTSPRLDLARSASAAGAMTAVDIGHRGYVRYGRAADVHVALAAFHLIQAPSAVAGMIAARLGVPLRKLPAISDATWIVTSGAEGVRVIGTDQVALTAPAPEVDVVDTIGAGDALLGGVLAALDADGCRAAPPDPLAVHAGVLSAYALVSRALSTVGARGHFPSAPATSHARSLRGMAIEQLRELHGDECPLCGYERPPRRRSAKLGAASNVGYLAARVRSAVATRAVEGAREWLDDPRPTVVCGSGGSYPAAELIADVLNERGGCAFVRHPAEHLAIPSAVDRVLCVSYSGTNKDTETVLQHSTQAGVDRVGLLTINPTPRIAEIGTLASRIDVLSYNGPSSRRERGFVSIAATVAPAAVWVAAAHSPDAVVAGVSTARDAVREYADVAAFLMAADRGGSVVELLATGWARPAALDLESKMTESATVTARLHDTKDFSHGRFVSVLETDHPRILVTVGPLTPYQAELAAVLSADVGPFHHLAFERDGALGALDALVAAQHIAALTAGFSGRDLSRPDTIPQPGLTLYKWEGPLP
jgi:sugar/nucleoside kinase (ribokinase family)/fructoselysine-6-P-deglycase FrlB-like protein